MKKIVRRALLITLVAGAALVVRQVISDLSTSANLWKSVTDEVENPAASAASPAAE